MMTDTHWGFIIAAYLVAALVIGGMTLKILIEHRSLKKLVGELGRTNSPREDAL